MPQPIRVLVVDDCPEDGELTITQLRRALLSNPIERVESGEDALDRLRDRRAEPIDLVLLDARLPRMSGEQTAAAIREDGSLRDVSVILLSNLAPMTAVDGPYDGILEKPLRLGNLPRILRRVGGYQVVLQSAGDA